MKKIVLMILLVTCFSIPGFAHWMPESELVLGGVTIGSTLGYVKSIYGEPVQVRSFGSPVNKYSVYGKRYIYSPWFTVSGRTWTGGPQNEDDYYVWEVVLRANNLSTPSGITVGVPYSTVVDLYGPGEYFYNKEEGRAGYIYNLANLKVMILYLDKYKNISEVYIGQDY